MYVSATVVEMFDKIKVQDIYWKVIYIYRQKIVNRQQETSYLLQDFWYFMFKFANKKKVYCV